MMVGFFGRCKAGETMAAQTMIRLCAVLLLAACALPAPVPVAARLSQQALKVDLSNGTVCSAPLQGAAPWEGDLPACALHFLVTPTAAGHPVRLAFDAMIAALRAGDLVAPMADITLTDAGGQSYHFASPVGTDP